MLADSGERLPAALAYAQRAAQLKPNDPSVSDTYGYVLHKNGKDAEAAEKLAFAVQQYEQGGALAPPEVYEHLGMVRESLGAKVEALAAYREALDTGRQTLSEAAKERLTKAIERLSR
jgi:predicted Zn-dependent protease